MNFAFQKRHLLLNLVLGSLLSASAFAADHTVAMKSINYDPKTLEIKVGDTIEWKNVSMTEHSATSYDDEKADVKFDTGLIQPKKTSKKIDFKKPGKFLYHCKVHGKTMTGSVTVTQ